MQCANYAKNKNNFVGRGNRFVKKIKHNYLKRVIRSYCYALKEDKNDLK